VFVVAILSCIEGTNKSIINSKLYELVQSQAFLANVDRTKCVIEEQISQSSGAEEVKQKIKPAYIISNIGWECSDCTFVNNHTRPTCYTCGAAKP